MQTISDLRQQLQLISEKLEELSHTSAFQALNQDSQIMCDVSLADSWQGIESAISLLDSQYSITTFQN
ncbi:MAG: hypothetical protein AAF915_13990 [Cyanobacteria bacterium P01_D01_bin.50]